MVKKTDLTIWTGRIDDKESTPALRWHQVIKPWEADSTYNDSVALLGFACDEGVRRNKGRTGAHQGPLAIRSALANLSYRSKEQLLDAGDIVCEAQQLEQAQEELAVHVEKVLKSGAQAIVLGGGHEIAWGSFQGLSRSAPEQTIGIINLDAHFDLRSYEASQPSSGTPFRQISQYCENNDQNFNYFVLGINPSANTQALFDYAKRKQVQWFEDLQCNQQYRKQIYSALDQFIQKLDCLYLTICLDVFSAAIAPGVSAPAALGIPPEFALQTIKEIQQLCDQHEVKLALIDIAELNPELDQNQITAKLAARIIYQLVSS
jgi:formiminoglutamase